MPGIGVLIDGAMQHAAQPDRQAGGSVAVSADGRAAEGSAEVTGAIIGDPRASHRVLPKAGQGFYNAFLAHRLSALTCVDPPPCCILKHST
jgi:hypothetical protein